MCDAYSIVAGAVTLAQGLSQRDAAKEQVAFQEQLAAYNRSLATRERNFSESQLQRRRLEERARTAQTIEAITLRADENRAAAVASAADSGTTGPTLAALNSEFLAQSLGAQAVAQRNQEFTEAQLDASSRGLDFQLQRSLAGSTPPPTNVPNFLSILLNVGTSAAGAYRG